MTISSREFESPRVINGQGWHHLGKLYSNSNIIEQKFHKFIKCDCQYSRVKDHDPTKEPTKHAMDVHIAIKLIRSVIAMLACVWSRSPTFAPREYSTKKASMEALLFKEEIQDRKIATYSLIVVDLDVRIFLDKCGTRRACERPLPSRVTRENRPKWNGTIIRLTPVVGGPFVAPVA